MTQVKNRRGFVAQVLDIEIGRKIEASVGLVGVCVCVVVIARFEFWVGLWRGNGYSHGLARKLCLLCELLLCFWVPETKEGDEVEEEVRGLLDVMIAGFLSLRVCMVVGACLH